MWMAAVLICAEQIKAYNTCYVSMGQFLFQTEQECMEKIASAANLGLFGAPPGADENQKWVISDVTCYNWENPTSA